MGIAPNLDLLGGKGHHNVFARGWHGGHPAGGCPHQRNVRGGAGSGLVRRLAQIRNHLTLEDLATFRLSPPTTAGRTTWPALPVAGLEPADHEAAPGQRPDHEHVEVAPPATARCWRWR